MKHFIVTARSVGGLLVHMHSDRRIMVEARNAEDAQDQVFNLFLGQYKIIDVTEVTK